MNRPLKRGQSLAERSRPSLKAPPLFSIPAFGWFFLFLLIPLFVVLIYSFSTKGLYGGVLYQFTTSNYARAVDWIYLKIFWNSFRLAALTASSCLVIGYPMAYVMATSRASMRSVFLVLVVIPFWTNFVIRAYATKILFGEYGPLNHLAIYLGWVSEPIVFMSREVSVWLGMVTNYLPFMVLPLFVSLEKFDFSLVEAAKDLGAPFWKTTYKILFPLTKPGILTGLIFVFTPALGEFVIPDLLGGAKTMLIGNLITEQFLKTRDWPFGASLSFLLIFTVFFSLWIYIRIEAHEEKQVKQ